MSWLDRVQGTIELTSPDGEVFSAKWVGNTRSVEKKVGIFTYPKFDGAVGQDLGLAGTRYPLSLHFDGSDNDLESSRFFDAFSARGTWQIQHPTKGMLTLQPLSVAENIEPVDSGSITVFNTQWLQLVSPASVLSTAQLAAYIRSQSRNVDDVSLSQMTEAAEQRSVEEVNAIKNTTETTLATYDKTIASLLETSGELAAEAAGIRRGIADTLSTTPLDLTVLGGQIQAVMRTPSKVTGDILQTLKPFADFIDQVSVLPDEEADQNYLNILAIREIFLTSANSSMALVGAAGILDTRAQALEAAELLALQFQTVTNSLDGAQVQFKDLRVDQQYFSQSLSFVESAQITAGATRYLLEASFNLAVEKRFTLDRERAPIEITITEYGELGNEDSNFDLFISSNELKGNGILLLPAGREVVVYV